MAKVPLKFSAIALNIMLMGLVTIFSSAASANNSVFWLPVISPNSAEVSLSAVHARG